MSSSKSAEQAASAPGYYSPINNFYCDYRRDIKVGPQENREVQVRMK